MKRRKLNKKEESRKKKTHEGIRRLAGSQAARGGCNTETYKHSPPPMNESKDAKKCQAKKNEKEEENGERQQGTRAKRNKTEGEEKKGKCKNGEQCER